LTGDEREDLKSLISLFQLIRTFYIALCFLFSTQCYLVGFVLYCCYNSSREARRHRTSGGNADNPSGSPSSAPMMRRGIVLTSIHPNGSGGTTTDDDEEDDHGRRTTGGGRCHNLLNRSPRRRSSDYRRISPSSTPSSIRGLIPLTSCLYDEISDRNCDLPVNQPSPQPALLTAHREQQLRQIKLEINALSCRLGIGQIYRGTSELTLRDYFYNTHHLTHNNKIHRLPNPQYISHFHPATLLSLSLL